ncbi:uncharacterized protein M421DRAFT_400631 [Didymella exigua CBS 183.55]|uniref:Uncharacterized protein n=1 Tax=Didymella exigua CBS 183.55 TaxID=1150837 RepID=A0A6A5RDI3_9PLEO|nr:uncharacterized protein M421DRAFT_400631 [Didymella exigua CBS 183.55]KAF1925164.1 hypothetical protein M421DRAFT_400631 [Didymella exigua CBS 183.55]
MTDENQFSDGEDGQRHTRYLRIRALNRAWPPLTYLPRWRAGFRSETDDLTPSAIPLEEVVIHEAGPQELSRRPEQHRAFLELPSEIRTQIYSYLVPGVQPTRVDRAFRQTCRQINHELEHESRKAFTHEMTSLQQLAVDSHQYVTLFYSAEKYHVDMILQLPQPYFPPNLPPLLPQTRTIMDAVALSFVTLFPPNTRSIAVTMQPHPQGSTASFERYFDGTWACDAMEGKIDLRKLSILSGDPVVLVPEAGLAGFRQRFNWINILGVSFEYDRGFQRVPSVVIDSRQQCHALIRTSLRLLGCRLEPRDLIVSILGASEEAAAVGVE